MKYIFSVLMAITFSSLFLGANGVSAIELPEIPEKEQTICRMQTDGIEDEYILVESYDSCQTYSSSAAYDYNQSVQNFTFWKSCSSTWKIPSKMCGGHNIPTIELITGTCVSFKDGITGTQAEVFVDEKCSFTRTELFG